jgi:hypothetical protein
MPRAPLCSLPLKGGGLGWGSFAEQDPAMDLTPTRRLSAPTSPFQGEVNTRVMRAKPWS